ASDDKALSVSADASSSKEMPTASDDKAPESNLVMLDKQKQTASDKEKEDARYKEKRDAALAICRSKSDQVRKPAASQQFPYTAKVIIPNKKRFPSYNAFPPVDKKTLKKLAEWLKTDP
ncbi:hypothetical protein, partial [Bartonella sp. CL70QHWL]|uniref:hypothetical protein n=1 Tax=Bartonella sp. CL70QHWL TaxID=3243539 RepID=UPI0035D05848